MNDWVNCLRLVAFGQSSSQSSSQNQQQQQVIQQPTAASQAAALLASNNIKRAQLTATTTTNNTNKSGRQQIGSTNNPERSVDVLLEKRTLTAATNDGPNNHQQQQVIKSLKPATSSSNSCEYLSTLDQCASKSPVGHANQPQAMTASQAAAAAASALAKTRQRQPSLLGSCKPQPPNDSPFINQQQTTTTNSVSAVLSAIGQIDTLTPTVRGQLISASSANLMQLGSQQHQQPVGRLQTTNKLITPVIQATLDEEEENMLYCSIEDNPSEHNYRVKVIETELSLRCQLKCYQLTAPTTISQQYEQLGQFSAKSGAYIGSNNNEQERLLAQPVTFYQLIIGPQELTLLNDYAAAAASLKQQSILQQQQQGLWSWPYQCIRRYGFDKDNCFMFEAGRKCTSGPGQFIVQTPKAYQIYQDVVKFVNELRSLNSTTTTTSQPSTVVGTTATPDTKSSMTAPNITAYPTNLEQEQRQKSGQSIVTQIPVTWTPNNTTNIGSIDITVSETRQQFFDTLRQLDSSSSSSASLVSSSLSPSSLTNHVQQQTSSKNCSLDNKTMNATFKHTEPTVKTITTTNELVNNFSSNTSQETLKNRENDVQIPSNQLNWPSSPISNSNTQSNTSSNSSVHGANHNNTRIYKGDKQTINDSPNNSLLTTNQKCDNSPTSGTPEETDESGYEQGDDSVEDNSSATSRLVKLTATSATRKRQANDSMSSSSSTTSSSGGSPGHSVSRRSTSNGIGVSGVNFNTQGPSKRPLLNTTSSGPTVGAGAHSTSKMANKGNKTSCLSSSLNKSPVSKIIGLHNIIGDDPHEDFEANLIRDVYSEITKLHAKFAVTSGSTEDLMSSNSSNAGSSDNCSANSNEQDCESSSSAMAEPMYSNLRPPSSTSNSLMQERQRPQARGQVKEARDFELEDEENINPRISSSTNNKFNQPRPQQPSQGYHHVDHERSPLRNSYPMINNFDYLSSQAPPPPPPSSQAIRGPLYTTMLNPIPEISEAPTPKQPHNTNAGGGRNRRIGPPTNHYVINDVQYAKISRNI